MLLRYAAAITVLLAWHAASRASACSCAIEPQADAFRTAAAVFEGRVTAVSPAVVEQDVPASSIDLAVVRSWKGVERERVVVRTAAAEEACGFPFARDESYLVYAVEHADGLWVSRCGRTRPVASADEDLRALGMGVTPVEPKPDADEGRVSEPPARGGCAGCAVSARPGVGLLAWILVALSGSTVAFRLRARRVRRR